MVTICVVASMTMLPLPLGRVLLTLLCQSLQRVLDVQAVPL